MPLLKHLPIWESPSLTSPGMSALPTFRTQVKPNILQEVFTTWSLIRRSLFLNADSTYFLYYQFAIIIFFSVCVYFSRYRSYPQKNLRSLKSGNIDTCL